MEKGVTKLGTFNNLNQLLTLQTGAVPIPMRASVNKVVTNPTINGQPAAATYSASGGSLSGSVTLPPGTNAITLGATDPATSQPITKTYQVPTAPPPPPPFNTSPTATPGSTLEDEASFCRTEGRSPYPNRSNRGFNCLDSGCHLGV